MKRFLKRSLLAISLISLLLALPEVLHKNSGESTSIGSVRNGKLKQAYLVPWSGPNFRYFSFFSYYILNYGYVHSKVHRIVLDAYETCDRTCPGIRFKYMHFSRKRGGQMLVHWTHQNGMSADFMVVKQKDGKQHRLLDRFGFLHYGLDFNETGHAQIAPNISIDFETIGKHILALDDAASAHGMRIRKILLRVELLDELYATAAGQEVRERGIFIVPRLPDMVNRVHDDHYHVDFEFVD